MRSIKGSFVGLVLAGILALAPSAAFAHGGGGGHFGGGGGHFAGFAGHSFGGHSFAQRQGAHFARHEDHTTDMMIRTTAIMMTMLATIPMDNPHPAEVTPSQETIIALQKELTQLGYYHSNVDGLIGPQTEKAIRWFQSVEKLPLTGQIDDPTLKALRIS